MDSSLFKNVPYVEKFISYQSLVSTNETAHTLEKFPDNDIIIIQADKQTSGKGRRGNTFFSNSTGGLWVTIITRINDISAHFTFNRAISLSIAEILIEQCKRDDIKIKWPNDIYISDKKICGILLEMHRMRNDILIIGFGVNVNIPVNAFPEELQSIATSLSIETGITFSLESLLLGIIDKYIHWTGTDKSLAHKRYSELLYKTGHLATVENKNGIFETVLPDGHIKLITECGIELLDSGTLRFN